MSESQASLYERLGGYDGIAAITEDIWDNHRLPQALWAYVDAALALRERDMLRLRYDFRIFLDRRESTLARVPNPEHWLWLEYVFRY